MTIADRPPAQIRTSAFTHTALTKDEWRQWLLAAHRAVPGTCFSRSVSGACGIERCSSQSVPFPPRPPRKVVFRCSAGSRVQRHNPTSPERSRPPFGLWPSRTGLGLLTKTCRRSPGSRACCFSACAGSQTTQDRQTARGLRGCRVAFVPSERSRRPVPSAFRSSIARPTDTSVYASSGISRRRLQDSRPRWIRCSFPVGLFHPLQHAGLSRRSPISAVVSMGRCNTCPKSSRMGLAR
jgi:hypothetical protein